MFDFDKLLNAKRVIINYLDINVNSDTVKRFRKQNGLTQIAFANIMGVSKKTVEKWEQGANKLSGSSAVLLTLLNNEPDLLEKVYCVQKVDRTYTDYKIIAKWSFDTNVLEEKEVCLNSDFKNNNELLKRELLYAGGV